MPEQPVDYTSRDFASLRQSMLDDAAARLPEWTSREPNDFGVVLIEEFAYTGDILSYYIDRVANESFLATATQRSSLLNIAAMLDYRPDTGIPAKTTLLIGVVPGSGTVAVPAGSQFSSASATADTPLVIFETDEDLFITQAPSSVATAEVGATQGETITDEALGTSVGTEDQAFDLLRSPVIEGSVRVFVDEGAGPVPWQFVEHLVDRSATARVFTTTTDATGQTTVIFGDSTSGRVPFSGAPITATYRVGGGTVGNVGPRTVTSIVSAPSEVTSVVNLGSATGGTDSETNDQIRRNAPLFFSTLRRAVTLEDYANLCYGVANVTKAVATGLTYTAITVYVTEGVGAPSNALKQQVLDYLADKKMVNARIIVADPTFVPVNIGVQVYVEDQYSQSAVRTAVSNALAELLAFGNVDFGQTITISDVYRAVMAVPGVKYANVTLLSRTTVGTGDVSLSVNEIPTGFGAVSTVEILGGGITTTASGGGVEIIPGAPGAPVIDSISCGTAPFNNQYTLALHWAPANDATSYQVILDFWNAAAVYQGSQDGGTFTDPGGVVSNTFAGADEVRVHVRAIRGVNSTPGPITSAVYPCG